MLTTQPTLIFDGGIHVLPSIVTPLFLPPRSAKYILLSCVLRHEQSINQDSKVLSPMQHLHNVSILHSKR